MTSNGTRRPTDKVEVTLAEVVDKLCHPDALLSHRENFIRYTAEQGFVFSCFSLISGRQQEFVVLQYHSVIVPACDSYRFSVHRGL